MRVIFCDDNTADLDQMQKYVADFFHRFGTAQPEYAAYTSGETLIAQETQADIAFLDVEMPGMSGIHVGVHLKKWNPNIKIFIITAYPDYLDEAMRFQVFRYLSKPIDKNRLFRNLKDAIYRYNMDTVEYPIETGSGILICRAEDIVCVETSQRKTKVFTVDGVLESTQRMEHWLKLLTLPCFFSPHRSFIVNMKYVHSFSKDTILLRCHGMERTAFLTRRKYTQFKDTFLLFLESTK